MKMLKVLVVTAVAAVGLGVGIGSVLAHGSPAAAAATTSAGHNLYVVDGETGVAKKAGASSWNLELSSPTVLWFQDRPLRNSGTQSIGSLVADWPRAFASSAPNAAVVAPAGPVGHHPTAVKLTSPTYDRSRHVVRFTLTADKSQSDADNTWLSRLTSSSARKNGRVVLFVDTSGAATTPAAAQGTCIVFNTGIGANQEINCSPGAAAENSNIIGADLEGTNFSKSQLAGSYFGPGSSLGNGDLSQACLEYATLPGGQTFTSDLNC